ncbi:hypothetical protein THF1C08_640002 [Vibrio jasicida]|uniref:Uncharacterized protein n=1 Tax=Vibrio jasicida TaxID=766224 RepID=A0AAU9QWL9_9VIBR|nr:hypothetical protein THF1C08_640002 [Vibrio jasicida]CAH1603188.1 hypothetical protein THF1A12_660002 [Vibrio jasicida]
MNGVCFKKEWGKLVPELVGLTRVWTVSFYKQEQYVFCLDEKIYGKKLYTLC